jgi:hypothetical protein
MGSAQQTSINKSADSGAGMKRKTRGKEPDAQYIGASGPVRAERAGCAKIPPLSSPEEPRPE